MKVNIILITYNHSHYIRQTLESILMQQTEHDVEIVVADDCSPDNTLEIIKEYENKTSFSFKYLANEKNLGYVKNYQQAFAACSGDYVTIMEGDDYWTEPNHLENHIIFLESHPECSMCFNRHVRLFEDQNREEIFDWNTDKEFELITTSQLATGNRIGNLSCCTFRGRLIKDIDPKLFDIEIADWMLGMYMGQFGALAYIKNVTSAYRIHDNGQWSKMNEEQQNLRIIELVNQYDKYFDYKYTKPFTKYKQGLQTLLYGDKSLKGRMKRITPDFVKKIYRKL